jgi:hypothetical protein
MPFSVAGGGCAWLCRESVWVSETETEKLFVCLSCSPPLSLSSHLFLL